MFPTLQLEFRFLCLFIMCDNSKSFILKVSLYSGNDRRCTEVSVANLFEACVFASYTDDRSVFQPRLCTISLK